MDGKDNEQSRSGPAIKTAKRSAAAMSCRDRRIASSLMCTILPRGRGGIRPCQGIDARVAAAEAAEEEDTSMSSLPNPNPRQFELEEEIERLHEQLRAQRNMYMQAVADCENYRKRVERAQEKTVRRGKRDLFLLVLDVLDEFDRTLKHAERDPDTSPQGVRVIRDLLMQRIQKEGVARIEAKGDEFDPELHEAVATITGDSNRPGTIVKEVRPGYLWGDELLRPAQVIVEKSSR